MDTLFHFTLAIVGAYILMDGLKIRYNFKILFLLSVISLSLDGISLLLHTTNVMRHDIPLSHNIFLAIVLPLVIYVTFPKKGLKDYSIIIMVLLVGHLVSDMITFTDSNGISVFNIYGPPLFFPLSDKLYLIPDFKFKLISSAGIALTIYFGIIFLILKLKKKFNKNGEKIG